MINYTGALTGSALTLGTLPAGFNSSEFTISTAVPNQIDLIVTGVSATLQYWDGPTTTATGRRDGREAADGTMSRPTGQMRPVQRNSAWQQGVAVFSAGSGTVTVADNITAAELRFVAGSGAYTVSVTPGFSVTFDGAGITNSSAIPQNFVTTVAGGSFGNIIFTNSATAGSLTQFTNTGSAANGDSGGQTTFNGNSTAGNGNFINKAGTVSDAGGGEIFFNNSSSAGNGIFENNGAAFGFINGIDQSGVVSFHDTSTAGNGAFTNDGGTVAGAGGGITVFFDNTSAGSGTFTSNGGTAGTAMGGQMQFSGSSTAANGIFTNNGATVAGARGGFLQFTNTSNAGGATLIANGGTGGGLGGQIYFEGSSTGGTARVELFGNGAMDISFLTTPSLTVGSVEGSGNVFLGANQLTVGSNNSSTIFSGVIQDGGAVGGVGGSFTTTGSGTLTLTGINTYTGPTTVNGGALLVNGSLAAASAVTVNSGGTLGGSGTANGAVTVASGGILTPGPGATPGTLTVGALTLNSGSILNYQLGTPGTIGSGVNSLTLVNGNLTLGGSTLNITGLSGFGAGTYDLINYTGSLTGSALTLGTLPAGFSSSDFTITTAVPNQIDLIVAGASATVQYWNGPTTTATGAVTGGAGTWNNVATNWTNATGSANSAWQQGAAAFSAGSGTVTLGDNITATELRFLAGSGAYTIAAGVQMLTINGAGVTNNSGIIQRFSTTPNSFGNYGTIAFSNSATAGVFTAFTNAGGAVSSGNGGLTSFGDTSTAGFGIFTNNGGTAPAVTLGRGYQYAAYGGSTKFLNASTAGNGVFTNNGGTVTAIYEVTPPTTYYTYNGGFTEFSNTSTASTGTFTNNGGAAFGATGGYTQFNDTSTAGVGFFTNNGATASGALSGGSTVFNGNSSAANGTFTNNNSAGYDGGYTEFFDTTSASNATVINNGGYTLFAGAASAGNATLIANGGSGGGIGGGIYFEGSSTGGTARVELFGNGNLDISDLTPASATVGSIEGSGNVFLGAKNLTVGSNNASTTFSGVIQDGGLSGGVGGSFTTTGSGTLTLTGINTYTGATTVNGGALLVNGSLAAASTVTVNVGGALGGTGTVNGAVTIAGGGILNPGPGAGPGTLTVGALTLNNGSVLNYYLGAPSTVGGGVNSLTVVNGDLTLGGSTLNVTGLAGFAAGTYDLINYTGSLTGSALVLGSLPAGFSPSAFTITTAVPNQIDLIVAGASATVQYWNGPTTTATGAVTGGTGTWNNVATNWTNASGSTAAAWQQGVAAFSAGSGTVTLGDNITATELRFQPGSGAYTITAPIGTELTITGAGIMNTSGIAQNFLAEANGPSGRGVIAFSNNATAGAMTTFTNQGSPVGGGAGGDTEFHNTASAGSATFINETGRISGNTEGFTSFADSSTAGNGTFTNNGSGLSGAAGGATFFAATSTAGSGRFTDNGSLVVGAQGGSVNFENSSTAANGVFVNNGSSANASPTLASGGGILFSGSAMAGNGMFTNNAGIGTGQSEGITEFSNTSSAQNGTFVDNGAFALGAHGGLTEFINTATAGSGTLTNNSGLNNGAAGGFTGFLDSSSGATASVTNNGSGVAGASGGFTVFINTSTAGNGVFTNGGSGVSGATSGLTIIYGNPGVGTDPFNTTNGGVVRLQSGGSTQFFDTATAGNATFINNGGAVSGATGGYTQFNETSTAGSGTFTNNGGGVAGANGGFTQFNDTATAGSATLIANSGTAGGQGGQILFSGAAMGGTARVELFGNGALDISSLTAPSVTLGSIEGSGNVFLGANNLTVGSNNTGTIFSGVIQDGGLNAGVGGSLTKSGSGALTLTGINTYTGATTINHGALLVNGSLAPMSAVAVNSGGTLGGLGTVHGAVTVASGGILTPGSGIAPGTLTTGSLNLNSGSVLNYQLATPGVAGGGVNSLTAVNGNLTLGGSTLNITGLSGFGSGTFDLFNYTGLLTGSALSFGALPAGFTAANFTLQTSVPNQVDLIVNATGSGSGLPPPPSTTVNALGPNTVADSTTADVEIASLGTSGSVPIAAATTNINTLTQGFTTASTIDTSPGTLRLGTVGGVFIAPGGAALTIGTAPNAGILTAGGNTANVAGALLLENNSASDLTINSTVTDNGTGVVSVTVAGTGVTVFAGTNTYTGGTSATGGLIKFTSLSNFGSGLITLDGGGLQWAPGATTDVSGRLAPIGAAGGTFDTNGNNVTLASALTGPGSLTKQGAGTLTLTAANTYAGGTIIGGGLINFNNLANFGSGPITLNGGGLQWAAGTTTDISGKLMPIGPTGATFDTNGNNLTFASPLSGAGGLTKTGTGSLSLSAANLYTGNTVVSQGVLYVDGSIASANTVIQPGAIIAGHGVIGGSLNNDGVVSPGNSPGTLTISGNYHQGPSGTLFIEIAGLASFQHDLLAVGGSATLGGALQIVPLNGFRFSGLGQSVTFLTAGGGVIGTFSTINDPLASGSMFGAEVVYSPNSVAVESVQNSFSSLVSMSNGTPNEFSVAKALDASSSDPRNAKLIDHLDHESLADVLRDLDRIAPAELTSVYQVAISQSQVQSSNLERRLEDVRSGSNGFSSLRFSMTGPASVESGFSGPSGDTGLLGGPDGEGDRRMVMAPTPNNRWGVFVTGSGEWANVGDTNNARGYDLTDAGITLGVDFKATDHFAIGLGAGYDHTSVDLSSNGRVIVDGAKLALYATYFTEKGFYTDFVAQGGYDSYDSRRSAVEGDARSSTDGGELNALFGTGYDFKAGNLTFGPVANFKYVYTGFKGYTEQGSLAPLQFPSQHQESITSAIGAKASYDWKIGGVRVRPELRVRWQHEYSDNTLSIDSSFANGAGPDFTVHGPAIGRDSLLVGAGFAIQWNDRFSTNLYYDGELLRTNYEVSNITGGFRLEF